MRAIQQVVSRISAIQSTIAPTTTRPERRDATPAMAQHTFAQVMSHAMTSGAGLGGGYRTLGDYGGFGTGFVAPQDLRGTGGAPPGLQGYGNGRIPLGALRPIPGTAEHMWAPAADAFVRMRDAAARDGIHLTVVDAYRPYEDQVRLAAELGLYSEGGLAATPGTSQHGWGRAVDVATDDATVAWLRANAASFGFVETVPREPWHWEFHG